MLHIISLRTKLSFIGMKLAYILTKFKSLGKCVNNMLDAE